MADLRDFDRLVLEATEENWAGRLQAADSRLQRALTIAEELGDRSAVATSFHQLGIVAQNRGEYDQAINYYQRALTTFEELGDRSAVATSFHQLGIVAQNRGCLLYTSPSPRDRTRSRMPSSA